MTYTEFINSLLDTMPPASARDYLKVLWFEKKGQWKQSHDIAQEIHNEVGSRLHAYLHRREGDNGNARYWYNQAGLPFPKVTMDEEWESMVKEFLG
ncbi:MAG: hypothetical protein ABI151_05620 [Chitinophagaceae bacterium]